MMRNKEVTSMKNKSTLAKLLAEEDIHVVHKQQSTAMFDVLNRELSLPIWKDMPKNIQDLFTLHEVGHALWTPLEMMTKVKEQKVPKWFEGEVYDEGSVVQNRFSGEEYELNALELSISMSLLLLS